MIVLKVKGGLGNQLFQYAFARAIKEVGGGQIILDTSDFQFGSQRDFSLSNFPLIDNCYIDSSGIYNRKYDRKTNQFLRTATKVFPKLSFWVLSRRGILIWDRIDYKEIPCVPQKKLLINGFWQSSRYFDNIRSILLKEIFYDVSYLPEYKVIEASNSVCVHIRRGDYLDPSNHLNVCKNEYYKSAVRSISEKFQDAVFFVFSDSIDDVRKLGIFDEVCVKRVVYIEDMHKDYEEIMLMSKCKHFIMSNSSFSWWAQYLSQNSSKEIYAPSVWYDDGRKTDIHMPEWNLLTPEGKKIGAIEV